MEYIKTHTTTFLESRGSPDPWTSTVDIVIAHPNGWGCHEQDFLQTAAIAAHLAPSGERVYFVEEAEAAARYCLSPSNTVFAKDLKVSLIQCRMLSCNNLIMSRFSKALGLLYLMRVARRLTYPHTTLNQCLQTK